MTADAEAYVALCVSESYSVDCNFMVADSGDGEGVPSPLPEPVLQ